MPLSLNALVTMLPAAAPLALAVYGQRIVLVVEVVVVVVAVVVVTIPVASGLAVQVVVRGNSNGCCYRFLQRTCGYL